MLKHVICKQTDTHETDKTKIGLAMAYWFMCQTPN